MSRPYPCRLWVWDVCSVDGLPESFIRVYPRVTRDSPASRHELQHETRIDSVDWLMILKVRICIYEEAFFSLGSVAYVDADAAIPDLRLDRLALPRLLYSLDLVSFYFWEVIGVVYVGCIKSHCFWLLCCEYIDKRQLPRHPLLKYTKDVP